MRQNPFAYPLVLVVWRDSSQNVGGWQATGEKPPHVPEVHSIGWLTDSDHILVRVAPHLMAGHGPSGTPEQSSGDMTIPRSAIIRITSIQRARK